MKKKPDENGNDPSDMCSPLDRAAAPGRPQLRPRGIVWLELKTWEMQDRELYSPKGESDEKRFSPQQRD